MEMLRPCPHCGSTDLIGPECTEFTGDKRDPFFWVQCMNCSAGMEVRSEYPDALVKEWNARTADAEISEYKTLAQNLALHIMKLARAIENRQPNPLVAKEAIAYVVKTNVLDYPPLSAYMDPPLGKPASGFICPVCAGERWRTRNANKDFSLWEGVCNSCEFVWNRQQDDALYLQPRAEIES